MMRIDQIADRADRSQRYAVTFSDGSVMRLYRQSIEELGLYTGMEFSDDDYRALKKNVGRTSAKMRAVRIISATNVSKADLERRLIQKGENPEQAAEAVRWMSQLNLVDDQKMAVQVVERCIAKGYGIERAKQALYKKRIPKAMWDEALADYPQQREYIADVLSAKLCPGADSATIRKAMDALIRKGHHYSVVRSVLNELQLDVPQDE